MEFLSTWRWWAILVASSLCFLAYQLGRRGSGRWARRLETIGGPLAVLFWGLAYLNSSWKGTLTLFIATMPLTIIGFFLFLRWVRPHSNRDRK